MFNYKLSDDLRKLLLNFLFFTLVTFLLKNTTGSIDSIASVKFSDVSRTTLVGGFALGSLFVGGLYLLRLVNEILDTVLEAIKREFASYDIPNSPLPADTQTNDAKLISDSIKIIKNRLKLKGRLVKALRYVNSIFLIVFDLLIPILLMTFLIKNCGTDVLEFIHTIYNI